MKKTGIVATVLASLLCGLPGLGLACWGLIGSVGPLVLGTSTGIEQNTLIGAILFIGGGVLLLLVPIVVGFLSLRKRRQSAPAYQPAVPAAPAQPVRAAVPAAVPAATPAPAPAASQAMSAVQEVYSRLVALNRPTAPYRLIDGRAENVDLIAEWKIVDAQWYEIFAKASLTKVFRIYLKFDPARREVRAMDREYTVQWRAGVPSLSMQASSFRGQKVAVSFGTGIGFTENLAPGVVYKYKFNTNEIKKPIQEAIAASGWKYKPVAFGKL